MLARSLCALALAHALAAQAPPCISNNDATNSVSAAITSTGFFGPSVLAYRFTPATTLILQAAEIYTASPLATASGYMTLEVWDEDPVTGLPGTRLAGGTWQAHVNLGLEWHGANFDSIVAAFASQNYWLVWREPGASRVPYEIGGVTMPFARLTNGVWAAQTPQPLKWRGYCSLLDGPYVQPIGIGCLSSTLALPASFTNHLPLIGNSDFQLEATGFAPGTLGVAILGANPAWVSLPIPGAPANCFLHADPFLLLVVPVGTGNQQAQHAVGAAGHCWLDFPLPLDPLLVGFAVDVQFAGLDPGSVDPLPFVFTNGVRAILF